MKTVLVFLSILFLYAPANAAWFSGTQAQCQNYVAELDSQLYEYPNVITKTNTYAICKPDPAKPGNYRVPEKEVFSPKLGRKALFSDVANMVNTGAITWIHHSIDWWEPFWKSNCTNNTPPQTIGFFPKETFKWNGITLSEAIAKINTVTSEQRALGFQSIPSLGLWIHKNQKPGMEFKAWFDINVWTERAVWIEAMVPYIAVGDNRIAIDIEPYWTATRGNPRYPSTKDIPALKVAMKPFADKLIALNLKLYLFPADPVNFAYVTALKKLGVDMVLLDEGTYDISDFYGTNQSSYESGLDTLNSFNSMDEPYIPGFFETGIQSANNDFLTRMAKLGYKETWIFIRTSNTFSSWDKFCLPEFFR